MTEFKDIVVDSEPSAVSRVMMVTGLTAGPPTTGLDRLGPGLIIIAATGRMQFGSHEVGETGFRIVASWTAGTQDGTNQMGTLNTTDFTINGTGKIIMGRQRDTIIVAMPNSAANALEFKASGSYDVFTTSVIPLGFRADDEIPTFLTADQNDYINDSRITMDSATTNQNWTLRCASALQLVMQFQAQSITTDVWPVSMPGIVNP